MSKRHFVIQPDHPYRCVSCRQEFSTREELGKHYGIRGKCKPPRAVGMHLDIEVSPYPWTHNKAVRVSKAA